MTHQINRCACGRVRHWPAYAKVGDAWRCRRCGTTTRLVVPGTPGADDAGFIGRSRPPRFQRSSGRPLPVYGRYRVRHTTAQVLPGVPFLRGLRALIGSFIA